MAQDNEQAMLDIKNACRPSLTGALRAHNEQALERNRMAYDAAVCAQLLYGPGRIVDFAPIFEAVEKERCGQRIQTSTNLPMPLDMPTL